MLRFVNKIVLAIVDILIISGMTTFAQMTTDRFVCAPLGYCNTNSSMETASSAPGPPPGINPRIVTPGQLCPSGMQPCVGQGLNSRCGQRFMPPASMEDGIASNGTYPWQVYLQNTTHIFAGSGVLLDNYHVLTAAHKVLTNAATPFTVTVYAGLYNPDNVMGVQKATVVKIIAHPNYTAPTLMHDIAVLRLSSPIALNLANVNTACLPPTSSTSYVGKKCVVSGWGQTSFNVNDAPTQPLKQVYVNVVNYATCRASFANPNLLGTNVDTYLDPMGEICAGGESMRDACSQDGGSPLVCLDSISGRYYIAGLVIWGKNCGLPGVYGVYVSVPYYKDWIDTTIGSLNIMMNT